MLPQIIRTKLGYPVIPSQVFTTAKGTRYLKHPGVAVHAVQVPDVTALSDFLSGFPPELEFDQYIGSEPDMPAGTRIVRTGGELCYLSFGPKRTKDPDRYIKHLLEMGHGSVFEHAVVTFVIWGISRSCSHELVRHRAGFAYSQLSQRYVGAVEVKTQEGGRRNISTLRYVERPEYQGTPALHQLFLDRIDGNTASYESLAEQLIQRERDLGIVADTPGERTEQRKRVRQAARSLLFNETETAIQVTANLRAWRHFIEMRCSEGAEIEIRILAEALYRCLVQVDATVFGDYTLTPLPDGTFALDTPHRKV